MFDALFPVLLLLAFWDGQSGLVFAFPSIETKGHSPEDIDSNLGRTATPAGVTMFRRCSVGPSARTLAGTEFR
jgi:hypothetical protein